MSAPGKIWVASGQGAIEPRPSFAYREGGTRTQGSKLLPLLLGQQLLGSHDRRADLCNSMSLWWDFA